MQGSLETFSNVSPFSRRQQSGLLAIIGIVAVASCFNVWLPRLSSLVLVTPLSKRALDDSNTSNGTLGNYSLKGGSSTTTSVNEYYTTPSSPNWPDQNAWATELGDLLSPHAELYNNMEVAYDDMCDREEVGYSFFEEHRGICLVFSDCQFQFCNRNAQQTSAISPYTVKVATPEDISVALAFANKYNIQVSVKLTGHNFAGQGYTKDSLNIWVIHMETHGIVHTDFQDTCGTQTPAAVGISGGALNNDVFQTVPEDFHIVTGDTRSVGFAGWLLGAGLSHTSRTYGLGVDNILGYDIVLANGTEVVADACTNSDLFWALRGGGGGFGVVTHMYYKLHPVSTVTKIAFLVKSEISREELRSYMQYWTNVTMTADTRVAGGYFGLGNFEIFVMGDKALARKLFVDDFQEFLDHNIRAEYSLRLKERASWHAMLGGAFSDEREHRILQKFGHGPKASARIIPKQMVLDERDRIIEFFLDIGMNHDMGGYWFGGAVAEVDEHETAAHPALRSALWAMTTTDRKASQAFRDFFDNSVSGCSFNHHSPEEPEWRTALWGDDHYRRLLEIKQKYDPDILFNCWHCVGYQGTEFSVSDIPIEQS